MKFISAEPLEELTEGAGSLYQRCLFSYLCSKHFKKHYLHVDQKIYSGHYESHEYVNAVATWKAMFAFLSKDNQSIANYPIKEIEVIKFSEAYKVVKKLGAKKREILLREVRENFHDSVLKSNVFKSYDENQFTVAIHIRGFGRGDIDWFKYCTYPWQYFNENYGLLDNNPEYYAKLYSNIINQIFSEVKGKAKVLHIHTVMDIMYLEKFVNLIDGEISINVIEDSAPITFLDMVYADVLVASHSSFSWLALLLRSKVSYIRSGFRYFITENTKLIPELIYENQSWHERIKTCLKKYTQYIRFYPKYYFYMLKSGLYRKKTHEKYRAL